MSSREKSSPGVFDIHGNNADKLNATSAGSLEEWQEWRGSVRAGMRKPLGMDYRRRRYWVLGGRAAAWCIYVEDDGGNLWGWYEGMPSLTGHRSNAQSGPSVCVFCY